MTFFVDWECFLYRGFNYNFFDFNQKKIQNFYEEKPMKKYTLPFIITLLVLQVGCKDENQNLPEQGHHGPSIDVQQNMKIAPKVKDHTEE